MHRKNKVGAIVDRRFGENDPTMTPEERAAERFARESQKKLRKESMFNLEDEEEEMQLTHMGQTIFGPDNERDDFKEDDIEGSDDDSDTGGKGKRKRIVEVDDMGGLASESEEEEEQPRKKTKKEVMEEIIAKSKMHKYERQKAKEEDDDLRQMLDKGLPDIFDMLRGVKKPAPPDPRPTMEETMNPERAALLIGTDKDKTDKEYDQRLKLLGFDKRAKPADRTKTEEEKAEEEAERLRKLEEERMKRMRGEEDEESDEEAGPDDIVDDESEPDDAKQFGLHQPSANEEMGVEDEDDFIIDEDLVEMDSVADLSLSEDNESSSEEEEEEDEDDEEFTSGLTLPMDGDNSTSQPTGADKDGLAYTYPCPGTHEDFLGIIQGVEFNNLPTVVQRIRALHHPRLHPDNKAKLGVFAGILVQHVAYLASQPTHPPFAILENLLRHVHSLAKSHPDAVASAFRNHLRKMEEKRPLNLLPADLIILTGVSTIFPTSDHFHPVVTPAMLSMGRYLGQGALETLGDLVTGAYIGSLCFQYQNLSKRYVPEFINYVLNALLVLSPSEPKNSIGFFPSRKPAASLRLGGSELSSSDVQKLAFWDVLISPDAEEQKKEQLKVSLLSTFTSLVDSSAELWAEKSAFFEIFNQARQVLKYLGKACAKKVPTALSDQIQRASDKIQKLLSQAKRSRRPLLLHNHRPLAIKMAIPKFEESFNPDRHYDPDRERAELNKLKAEHKKERKGAMRELRKDANFIARENLREKRERDEAYEKKYRRIIAEIQGEEGREAKAYEREKKARQGKR